MSRLTEWWYAYKVWGNKWIPVALKWPYRATDDAIWRIRDRFRK